MTFYKITNKINNKIIDINSYKPVSTILVSEE